ncbi:MAG: hypothetical protein ABSH48_26725 [Verrucomicrobiota bacterium]
MNAGTLKLLPDAPSAGHSQKEWDSMKAANANFCATSSKVRIAPTQFLKSSAGITLLLSISVFSCFGDVPGNDTNAVGNTSTNMTQEPEPYDPLWESKMMSAEKLEQAQYQEKKIAIQIAIDSLNNDLASKDAAAKSANEETERLRSEFLSAKSTLKDPWRELYGEKRFVMSDSKFLKFSGQILEVSENGIRVLGQFGNTENSEYFIVNCPYKFQSGESFDPTKNYVALEDGTFSFVSEDGYAKSIPKLNYGKPCARPDDADTVEQTALQSHVASAAERARAEEANATLDRKRIQESNEQFVAVGKEAAEKMRLATEQALQYDLAYAESGNLAALRRMKERYENGDGVEEDTNRVAQYEQKYQARFQNESERVAEKKRLAEQDELRQKFLINLALADKNANAVSALYVSKCYRDGIGTDKDSSKADQYYHKAINLGLPRKPNEPLDVHP